MESDGRSFELLRSIVGDPLVFHDRAVFAAEMAGAAICAEVVKTGMPGLIATREDKDDGSPVSAVDKIAHGVLLRELTAIAPFPIVSEEDPAGVPSLESLGTSPFFWLADPLDGTRDFLAGEKTFAVALALMRLTVDSDGSKKVRPFWGGIVDPSHGISWSGHRLSALRKRIDGKPVTLEKRETSVSELRILGSRSIPSERLKDLYRFWGVSEVTRMGSAIKFALIAEGIYDVYPRFGPTSEWDTAAAQVLLEITGGGLVALDTKQSMQYGKPTWRNGGFIAARTTAILDEWLPKVSAKITQR